MSDDYFGKNYSGTTASELDHYFRNYVGIIKDYFSNENFRSVFEPHDISKMFDRIKKDFIYGLEKVIQANLPQSRGITNQDLAFIIKIAKEKDWQNIKTIQLLYQEYYRLRPPMDNPERESVKKFLSQKE